MGEQAARRRDRGIQRRITAAHFAEHKTLETFDWKLNKTINRAQYEQLATGDFIRRRANVVLVGQSGVGKSHLMQAVGLSACTLGYRAFYTTSSQMLIQLTAALADKSLNETLKRYASWDLLRCDHDARPARGVGSPSTEAARCRAGSDGSCGAHESPHPLACPRAGLSGVQSPALPLSRCLGSRRRG